MNAKLVPVIHAATQEQVFKNLAMTVKYDCDGVFLIGNTISQKTLIPICEAARDEFVGTWIGANFLELHPATAIDCTKKLGLDGIWADNAMLDSPAALEAISASMVGFRGKYFGGVAFKYQDQPKDLVEAGHIARIHMDVLTTSGDATGQAPTREKVANLKEGTGGGMPIAIASGLTPENVNDYDGVCDYVLVATGISTDFENFDPELLSAMRDATR